MGGDLQCPGYVSIQELVCIPGNVCMSRWTSSGGENDLRLEPHSDLHINGKNLLNEQSFPGKELLYKVRETALGFVQNFTKDR